MASDEVGALTDQLSKAKVDASEVLSFAGKGLKLDNEADAGEIVKAIHDCQALKALRLEGNTLGVDAAKAISKALEKHPEFERALWSDMFTGRLKSEIPSALRYLGSAIMLAGAQLVELDLSDNAFGPNGMEGLTELLKSKTCYTLQELRLNNNGLGTTGGKMLAKCLLECYKSSSAAGHPLALRVFVSGRGRLENEGSIALAEAFKAMGSLVEVSMPQNGINHPGISALADAFAHNKNLKILNLNDNTFTEKGARAMSKALPHMQKLEVLNFGDCLLRSEGAKAIAEGIREGHQQLREVTVSFNEINRDGGNAIAESMVGKDKLEKLELDGNQLGEEGIELVRASLETINMLDRLGSLSDDEGSEDEDEEGEEEVPEDEDDGEEVVDPALQVSGTALTPRSESNKPISASEFLQFPSPTKLHNIGSHRASAIVEHLGDDIHDVNKSIQAYMKVSSVVKASDQKSVEEACECADAIFSEMLSESEETLPSLVVNSLLVNLGLLKSEEKKFRPPSSIAGPLLVLEHVVQQDFFPKIVRDILQVFISRPHPTLEACSAERQKLLAALYKF